MQTLHLPRCWVRAPKTGCRRMRRKCGTWCDNASSRSEGVGMLRVRELTLTLLSTESSTKTTITHSLVGHAFTHPRSHQVSNLPGHPITPSHTRSRTHSITPSLTHSRLITDSRKCSWIRVFILSSVSAIHAFISLIHVQGRRK